MNIIVDANLPVVSLSLAGPVQVPAECCRTPVPLCLSVFQLPVWIRPTVGGALSLGPRALEVLRRRNKSCQYVNIFALRIAAE